MHTLPELIDASRYDPKCNARGLVASVRHCRIGPWNTAVELLSDFSPSLRLDNARTETHSTENTS